MIGRVLRTIEPGEVHLVRCADVADALTLLCEWGEREIGSRVVAFHWREPPGVEEILEQVITSLARTALALWPEWYGARFNADAADETDGTRAAVTRLSGLLPPQSLLAWCGAAAALCREEKPPHLWKFPRATQAAQLALAIEPQHLWLVLASASVEPRADRLFAMARAAEWLAKETQARVAVLVPASRASDAALDSINFRVADLPGRPPPLTTTEEKSGLLVCPFHGNPHPDSPGEQLLAAKLRDDAELAGLFAFNETLWTVRGNSFTVDLVWPAGKVVVEVDGYRWHSDPQAFRQDRHRDYELVVSGYLVLRLTHDEVMEDPILALEKIRDLVALRRRDGSQHQGDDR